MKITKYFFIIIVFTFFSCNKKELKNVEKPVHVKHNEQSLQKVSDISFNLNETSTLSNIFSASFFQNDTLERFSFINPNDNTLVYYDSQNPKVLRLSKEGENGIGNIMLQTSFKMIAPDRFLLVQSNYGKMYLLDFTGKVLRTYEIFDLNNRKNLNTYPFNIFFNQPLLYENKLLMNNFFTKYFTDYSKIGTIRVVDLKTSVVKNIFRLSDKYNKGFWGALFKYYVSVCKTSNNTFLVSYPIDHNIYEINLDGELLKTISCKSEYIDEIKPFKSDIEFGNEKNKNWDKINNYSLSNSNYSGILYDKYRNNYYRIVYIMPTLEDVIKGKKISKFSIIRLNDKYRIIDETLFDTSVYSETLIFVTKKGLAIARSDLYKKNENELVFSIFK